MTGSATDYLWREVFDRGLFLRLLTDYALWEPAKRDKKGKAIGSDGAPDLPRGSHASVGPQRAGGN